MFINLVMRRDSLFRKILRTAKFRTLAYAYIFKSLISARDCYIRQVYISIEG